MERKIMQVRMIKDTDGNVLESESALVLSQIWFAFLKQRLKTDILLLDQ